MENKPPKEIQFVFDQVAPIFSKIEPYLREFSDVEERVRFLLAQLAPYEENFVQMINSMRSGKEPMIFEPCIRAFGTQNSLDLLLSVHFANALPNQEFQWDPNTGRPILEAKEIFPFALEAREAFEEGSRFRHHAFLTGLVFDVLSFWNEKVGANKKPTEDMIRSQFDESLKLVRAGLAKGKELPGLKLERLVVTTILLKRAGRIIFSILNNDYESYAKKLIENQFRSPFGHIGEIQKYGIPNNFVSCAIARFVPGLEPASAALLFYDYPLLLKDQTKLDVYELVDLCADLSLEKQED